MLAKVQLLALLLAGTLVPFASAVPTTRAIRAQKILPQASSRELYVRHAQEETTPDDLIPEGEVPIVDIPQSTDTRDSLDPPTPIPISEYQKMKMLRRAN
ncbi:hypothetical protein SpCBS45565_g01813 [Spizellomyces sp. 'palustris']|nr:hypothetical protein SpCBS45565_g01813 [Spizellomyces sp. 'palustris']